MTETGGRPVVRTVLGDLDPAELGRTDYHEHLFQVSPLLAGDELDDEDRSGAEAGFLRAAGIAAIVDATPIGLGRRPEAVAGISAATGLTVVASTGAHREAHYAGGHWLLGLDEDALAERFTREIVDGQPVDDQTPTAAVATAPSGAPVRAGMVKTGVDYWSVSAFERRVLAAAARTHAATGAAVMVHLEQGTAGHEVLDLLGADGVPVERVVLAHADRNPDPGLHGELAARGAYLGYDGWARAKDWPDSVLLGCLAAVVHGGGGDRLLLGGDVARRSRYVGYGGLPGLAYLPRRVVPRIRERLGDEVVELLLVANPARAMRLPAVAGGGQRVDVL